MTQTTSINCTRCGKLIPDDNEALYRGGRAKNINNAFPGGNYDWKRFAHCAACDFEDYRNSPGGM